MANMPLSALFDANTGPVKLEATITYGKVNLATASASVAAFRVQAPFKRESAINTGTRSPGHGQYTAATSFQKIGGGFATERVRHDVGTILLYQMSRTRNKVRMSDGALFLRLRPGAAFLAINAKLPVGPESLIGDEFMIFQGNADILTVEELRTSGIEVARNYERTYMSDEEIAENFEVHVVTPESTPRPALQRVVAQGKVIIKEVAQEPIRRVGRLRRNT